MRRTSNTANGGSWVVVHFGAAALVPGPPILPPLVERVLQEFGLSPGYDEAALKSRYRKLAHELHPDHGGTDEQMKNLNNCREFLARWLGDMKPMVCWVGNKLEEARYQDGRPIGWTAP